MNSEHLAHAGEKCVNFFYTIFIEYTYVGHNTRANFTDGETIF